ncbi:MAG: hypothetical protein JJ845_001680 [Prochlorococcus marinus CUG1436]|nr:hypothetical protein [Prochlorococcus marinus CUG1436]
MLKEVCISSTIVLPSLINIEKRINLLNQIKMWLTFLFNYQKQIHILIVSNEIKTISNIVEKIGIENENINILEIKNKDLIFCNQSKNENFRYAFSKLDSLSIINNFLIRNKQFKKLIVSDIDSIFLDIKRIINYSQNIKSLAAINYRTELTTNYKFDQMLSKCIISFYPNFISNKKLAWINSGFIIFDISLLPLVIKFIIPAFNWINNNRECVKSSTSNHYSDEIVFSAIFNKFKGKELNNYSNKIARFFWTCNTKNRTPFFLNPFVYPSHIHLPASKFVDSTYQMSLLTKMGKIKELNLLLLLFINYWSIKSRLFFYFINSPLGVKLRKFKNFLKIKA